MSTYTMVEREEYASFISQLENYCTLLCSGDDVIIMSGSHIGYIAAYVERSSNNSKAKVYYHIAKGII